MKDKRTLLRVVKTKEAKVDIDLTNKADGRGAYVCYDRQCLEKAQKSKGFERSFRTKMPADLYDRLKLEIDK